MRQSEISSKPISAFLLTLSVSGILFPLDQRESNTVSEFSHERLHGRTLAFACSHVTGISSDAEQPELE